MDRDNSLFSMTGGVKLTSRQRISRALVADSDVASSSNSFTDAVIRDKSYDEIEAGNNVGENSEKSSDSGESDSFSGSVFTASSSSGLDSSSSEVMSFSKKKVKAKGKKNSAKREKRGRRKNIAKKKVEKKRGEKRPAQLMPKFSKYSSLCESSSEEKLEDKREEGVKSDSGGIEDDSDERKNIAKKKEKKKKEEKRSAQLMPKFSKYSSLCESSSEEQLEDKREEGVKPDSGGIEDDSDETMDLSNTDDSVESSKPRYTPIRIYGKKRMRARKNEVKEGRLLRLLCKRGVYRIRQKHLLKTVTKNQRNKMSQDAMRVHCSRFRKNWKLRDNVEERLVPINRKREINKSSKSSLELWRRCLTFWLTKDQLMEEIKQSGRTRVVFHNCDETQVLRHYGDGHKVVGDIGKRLTGMSQKGTFGGTALCFVSTDENRCLKPFAVTPFRLFGLPGHAGSVKERRRAEVASAMQGRVAYSGDAKDHGRSCDGYISSNEWATVIDQFINDNDRPDDVADVLVYDSASVHKIDLPTINAAKVKGAYFLEIPGQLTRFLQPLDSVPFARVKQILRKHSTRNSDHMWTTEVWKSIRSTLRSFCKNSSFSKCGIEEQCWNAGDMARMQDCVRDLREAALLENEEAVLQYESREI
jgi:hypothetical protein